MSMPSKANKENFRLLDLSSDEDSEDLQLEIIPNRKKKITRKRNFTAASQSRAPEPNIGAEVQCALCWAVRGTLVLWLLMLTWICAALYDQVSTMRIDIAKVSTSSDSVGDALQVCHTAAKELRANASELSARLSKLELEHQELSKRMEQAASELASVSGQLSAAPKLADTPRRLAELQRTVADFGSQIKGFESALTSTKKQAVAASTGVDEIKTTLHELEIRANETIGNMTDSLKKDNELKVQVTMLNETLIGRIDALQTKVEEYNKQAMTPALATLAPGTTSAPPATTFVRNVTAVPTPVPPVRKPMKVVVGDT